MPVFTPRHVRTPSRAVFRAPGFASLVSLDRSITSARRLTTWRDSRVAVVCKIAALSICRRTMERRRRAAHLRIREDSTPWRASEMPITTRDRGTNEDLTRREGSSHAKPYLFRKLIFTAGKSPRVFSSCQNRWISHTTLGTSRTNCPNTSSLNCRDP